MRQALKKARAKTGRLVDKLLPGSESQSTTPTNPGLSPAPPAPAVGRHEYADPTESLTTSATARSVVKELFETARDGSDLFLPLKAALVGVVKIWDICEACTGRSWSCLQLIESA